MKVLMLKSWLLYLIFLPVAICAEVKLPAIISDNMLLQQKTIVNIWGKANPGEVVSLKSSWDKQSYATKADENGKWLIRIATPKQSAKAHSLLVKGENEIVVNNILIGEVWLCSGQSNMDFPVAKAAPGWRTGIVDEEEEMKDADYREIRLFHVVQKLSPEQELDECDGKWMVCNRDNLKEFSAVAFFFGRYLYKNLNTPIGLVQSSWGGTHAESWTRMSVIKNDPVYAQLLADFYQARDNYPADIEKYEADLLLYNEAKGKGDTEIKKPKKPLGILHNKALSTLWNGMVNPLVPYTIKGAIWYQGESNSIRHWDYAHVFTNMINSWRDEWKQGDFPFYFVQIAPHYKQPPHIREAQLNVWKSVKNTGMVVITDAGDSTDIHPRLKQVPGERLARWALANDYKKKIPYSGPLYRSMKIAGNKVELSFDFTDKGLVAKDGEQLVGFMVAGEDKKFHPAKAMVVNKKVVVSADEVPAPVAVRYGWDNFFRVNLTNGAGLPASPFRTDNWKDDDK